MTAITPSDPRALSAAGEACASPQALVRTASLTPFKLSSTAARELLLPLLEAVVMVVVLFCLFLYYGKQITAFTQEPID